MPSPLDLPEVDMDQVLSQAPYRVTEDDLTGGDDPLDGSQFMAQHGGLSTLNAQRSVLPPDPIDALQGAHDAILDPAYDLAGRIMGAHDRLQGALSDSEAMSDRGRGELMDMRSRINRGDPWLSFAAAVSQPSRSGAMAALGQGIGAYNAGKTRVANQDMDVDHLLANFDNASGQQRFKNALGIEGFDLSSMNAASKLAAIRQMILQMRLKMAGIQALNDSGGGSSAAGGSGAPTAGGTPGDESTGTPGNNLISLKKAMMIQSLSGLPALDYWAKANPNIVFQNTGNSLIPLDPRTGRQVGKPIAMNIAPGQAAQMAQQRAQFKASTGVDLPDPTQPSGVGAAPNTNTATPNIQPSNAPAGNNPGIPNAQQQQPAEGGQGSESSQGFDSTLPNEGDVAKSVDKYIAGQNLPAVAAQKTRAQLLSQQPKNLDAVRQSIDTTNAVLQNVDSIINRVKGDPYIEVGPVGAAISQAPLGTPQYNTAKQLESVKHNLMRDAIEALRSLSTNGALNMRITQSELENMQSRIANVSMAQSPKQFLSSLQAIRNHFLQIQGRARQSYENVYGKTPDATLGVQKYYPTEEEARKAVASGEIKPGDKVYVGGVLHTWQPDQ